MSKVPFVLGYIVFMFFVIFVTVEMAKMEAVNPSLYNATNESLATGSDVTQSAVSRGDIVPPTCTVEGIDAMLDAAGCSMSYIAFFISMAFISSDFLILNIIIFLPLGLTFIWAIFEMIRGN